MDEVGRSVLLVGEIWAARDVVALRNISDTVRVDRLAWDSEIRMGIRLDEFEAFWCGVTAQMIRSQFE